MTNAMNCGIYKIEHVASGRLYVGSSASIRDRLRDHRKMLRAGNHHNRHLQRSWKKHGEHAFAFGKILICSPEHLLLYEQRCIDGYGTYDQSKGFNAVPIAGSTVGYKHTDESRAKIKAKRATQVFSEEHMAKWKAAVLAACKAPRSAEWLAKMSESGKRYVCSEVTRQKLRDAWASNPDRRTVTDELREKRVAGIMASGKSRARPKSPEQREKLRVANTGKKHSDATRAKMSASHKALNIARHAGLVDKPQKE